MPGGYPGGSPGGPPGMSPGTRPPGGVALKPPTNVTATVTGSDIVLTWDAASSVDGYNVYQSIDGGAWTKLNATTVEALTYTVVDPSVPGEYNFYVTSVRGTKESSPSNETTTTEAMMTQVYTDTITGLRISAVDGTAFVDSEDESVYESDFSAGLDGWTMVNDVGGATATWTFNADHSVLAVTGAGTSIERPYIQEPSIFTDQDNYFTTTINYTVNSGTCILTKSAIAGTVSTHSENLSGVGTVTITKKGNSTGPVPDRVHIYFDGRNTFNLSIHSITVTKHPAMSISADYTDGNHLLEVQDSGTTIASGVLKTQGATETFGATVNTGTLTAKTLYRIVATELNHFGTGLVVDDYFTSAGTETCDANNTVKAVLTPSAAGAVIVDGIAGTTENFYSLPAGFVFNEASYTCTVKKILPT